MYSTLKMRHHWFIDLFQFSKSIFKMKSFMNWQLCQRVSNSSDLLLSKSPCSTLKAILSRRELRTAPQKIGATVIAKTRKWAIASSNWSRVISKRVPSGLGSEQPNYSCKESGGGPEVVLSLLSAVAATHSCSCTRTELAWRVAARRYTLRDVQGILWLAELGISEEQNILVVTSVERKL